MAVYRYQVKNGVAQWVLVTTQFVPPPTGTGLQTSPTLTTSTTQQTKG